MLESAATIYHCTLKILNAALFWGIIDLGNLDHMYFVVSIKSTRIEITDLAKASNMLQLSFLSIAQFINFNADRQHRQSFICGVLGLNGMHSGCM